TRAVAWQRRALRFFHLVVSPQSGDTCSLLRYWRKPCSAICGKAARREPEGQEASDRKSNGRLAQVARLANDRSCRNQCGGHSANHRGVSLSRRFARLARKRMEPKKAAPSRFAQGPSFLVSDPAAGSAIRLDSYSFWPCGAYARVVEPAAGGKHRANRVLS